MDTASPDEHVFIIRVWTESREIEGAAPEYRGVIRHATRGDRRYLKSVESVPTFIVPYLKEMGVRLGTVWQLRQWYKKRVKALARKAVSQIFLGK
jgi:hypothetical protein